MTEVQVLLVVETDANTKTDDVYYGFLMRGFFARYLSSRGKENVLIHYDFIHMGGSGNHHSRATLSAIRSAKTLFRLGQTHVVYCFDVDRLGGKDAKALSDLVSLCQEGGAYVSLVNPEIETIFHLQNSADRVGCARRFARNNPRIALLPQERFFATLEEVKTKRGYTNFCSIIQQIIDRSQRDN